MNIVNWLFFRKEEKIALEREKEEKEKDEKRRLEDELKRQEVAHQREIELLRAANRLQQENFSKRINEITYNMNMQQQRPYEYYDMEQQRPYEFSGMEQQRPYEMQMQRSQT